MRNALAIGLTVVTVAGLMTAASPALARPEASGHIRVDQVGFAPGESKRAYLMTRTGSAGAAFSVVDQRGREVLEGT
ncbi:cellulase N-terminal Ig-like domain-containing protein [Nonomuraea sp. LPB2021202275-12-8]|uniref:cellulase N-terminal Ig-like domain-containing protein n=1 Tax=Nonomuraea sp. LPB2021202275-12-8 TaxID=3120159 RepID=UPI00300CEFE9